MSESGRHASAEVAHAADVDLVGLTIADRYKLLHRVNGPDPRFKATDLRLGRDVTVYFPNLDVDSAELIQGTADRPAVSSLQHPVLEPLLDVGYDDRATSTFVVTSYETSTALADVSRSADLALLILREVSSLLSALEPTGLGCSVPSLRHVRLVADGGEQAFRLRVSLGCLYIRSAERTLADDLADLAALVLSVSEDPESASGSSQERLGKMLTLVPHRPTNELRSAEDIMQFLSTAMSDHGDAQRSAS